MSSGVARWASDVRSDCEGRVLEARAHGRGEYIELESRDSSWFSGPRRDGNDRGGNRPGSVPIEIDEEVRREYWAEIRALPERADDRVVYG
jgi:hypothetical protein